MSSRRRIFAAGVATALIGAGVAAAAANPTVTTGAASSVTKTTAVLNGTVNPQGAATRYRFEYGLTASYGAATKWTSVASGTKDVRIAASLAALTPGTVYHYRLEAFNALGSSFGRDRTFKTAGNPPPGVITGPPTNVGHTSATVSGTVIPAGEVTAWGFRYGLTNAYGSATTGGVVPGTPGAKPVFETIRGLASGTTFHYQLVAYHAVGPPTLGLDQTFTTLPDSRPAPRVRAGTSPRRRRAHPFLFATSGRVVPPSWIPAAVGCNGIVGVRFFVGRRQVAARETKVQPNCTFVRYTRFRGLIGRKPRRVRVEVRFRGNAYLAPAKASAHRIQVG